MNSDHQSKEQALNHREAALNERELKLRLRELEADLTDTGPVQPTVQHSHDGYQDLPKIVKFGVVLVLAIIAVRVVAWLAGVLILLGIVWAGYKIFLEDSRD